MNEFSTCDMCDGHKSRMDGSFRVLPPVFRDFGGVAHFAGTVSTVVLRAANITGVRSLNGS